MWNAHGATIFWPLVVYDKSNRQYDLQQEWFILTVRHICGDLPVRKRERKSIYKLPLKENEEIIASM